MANPMIRRAKSHEADSINQLGIRSKAYWGCSPEHIKVLEQDLTISPQAIVTHPTYVLEVNNKVLGYYTLIPENAETVELAHLFVEPLHLLEGVGSQLLNHARDTALSLGFSRIVVQSDPNSERFYLVNGATRIDEIASRIPDQFLLLLEILLK
jgi:N-acetylglutamate synthase-like GNAT family acetyltransferase